MEPNNITMVGWVDRSLEQSLIQNTSSLNSKLQVYAPCKFKAMNTKTQPLYIFALQKTSITREINTITQYIKILITIKIRGRNLLLQNFCI
jgi:hypothetical protein